MPVHHLRFRPARDGRPGFEPVPGHGAAVGGPQAAPGAPVLVESLRRLVGAGCPADGPNRAYTRLPGGGALLYQISRDAVDADGYAVLVLPLPARTEADREFVPADALAEERWWRSSSGAGSADDDLPLMGGRRDPAARLVDLARRHPETLTSLLADVRGLFTATAGPQILLGARSGPVEQWIALLSASLPRGFERALTFTTASSRPYRAVQQIVGITPDADFRYAPEELAYTYRVRGTDPARCSPPADHPWASVVAALWLAGRPDLLHDSPLSSADPFDDGRLAVTALLAGIELGADARLAALNWMGTAENSLTVAQPLFDELAQLAGRLAGDAAAARAPEPGFDLAVRRAYLALKRRSSLEAILSLAAQSGRLVLSAALADCSRVTEDPLLELGLGTDVRAALCRDYEGAVRELFTEPRVVSCAHLEGAIVLAEALGVDWSAQAAESATLLTRMLLDRVGDQTTVLRVLDRAGGPLLNSVLHRLDAAAGKDVVPVHALYRDEPTGSWFRSQKLTSTTPLLQVVAAAAEPSLLNAGPVARFKQLLKRFGQHVDPQSALIMWELSLPQHGARILGLADARAVVDALDGPVLDASGIGLAAVGSLEHYAERANRRDLPELAELGRALRKIELNAGHEALVRLVDEVNRLNYGVKHATVPDEAARLRPLVDAAPGSDGLRKLALNLLISHLFEMPPGDLHDERVGRSLAEDFDGDLVRTFSDVMFADVNRRDTVRELTSQNDKYVAGWFSLWYQLAHSPQDPARAVGFRLLNEFMEPALDKMSTHVAKGVAKVLHQRASQSAEDDWVRHCVRHRLMVPEKAPAPQQAAPGGPGGQAQPPAQEPARPSDQGEVQT